MDFPHNLWDLSATNLPQQITNLDESDFLSILSKQLNPTAVPPQPISAHTLAQQINQQQGVSPPISEESSPSPPTTTNRGLAKSLDAAAAAAAGASAGADGHESQHKRKKIQRDDSEDSDSDEDQPPAKSQKEQPAKKGKRKSTGDESRAMKRKEQNRAAQRAFRERKEKHVKDLEDQVSVLEQKSTAQATENENLRELLGRLQNENLMLKQSAFTFNFNSAQTPRSTSTPTVSNNRTTPSSSSVTSPVDKSPPTAQKDTQQQQQQQGSTSTVTGYTPLLSFSSLGSTDNLISMGTPPMNTNNGNMNNNSPPLTWFSPPPTDAVPSPYTTLASNPMYTSYTDFSAWDQFFASAALDQTLAGVGSDPSLMAPANLGGNGANRMEDLLTSTENFSELIPFSSFSPNQGASNNANGAGMMTGVSTANSPIDRSTSAGQQLVQPQPSNAAFTLASRESAASANRPSLPVRSSSPCGGADPDEAPLPGSSHHNPSMSSMNVAKPNTEHDSSQCPKTKDDLAKLIEGQPLSTLGSVAGIPQAKQSFSEKKTMRLKEVWNALKNHPRFDEVDMDELCRELSSKVKCDGGMPGVDESDKPCEELGRIIDAVKAKKAEEAKAAQQVNQQQRVIQSISTGGLGDNSMSQSPPTATATANNNNNPAALSNFSLFGSSPYNSYLPFAMPPQSAGSTTSQFTTMTPHSADFGSFDSRRPSLGGAHNNSGSTDATSFMSGGSSSVATPQSASSGMGFAQSGATDPWLAGAFEMPPPTSPNSQFLSFLSGNAGGFSPNSYLNIPDKE